MTELNNLDKTMTIIGNPNPSEEQLRVCKEVLKGGNHAIFGETGTGKTRLIRLIVEELKGMGKKVLCVAPNYTATFNMGIKEALPIRHAFHMLTYDFACFSYIKDDQERVEGLIPSWENGYLFMPVIPDTLIIDEISMCRSDIFAVLDRIMRIVKKTDMPFGGTQLIVVGDPMKIVQLAPWGYPDHFIRSKFGSLYCFDTQSWSEANFKIHKLTTIYRQSQDPLLNKYLHAMHSFSITDSDLKELNAKFTSQQYSKDKHCILECCPLHAYVANKNTKIQAKTALNFYATIQGVFPSEEYPVERCLSLNIGDKVLLTANYHDGFKTVYTSGDMGTFIGKSGEKPVVLLDRNNEPVEVSKHIWEQYEYPLTPNRENCNERVNSFIQYPIMLGYSVDVEEAQGMTFSGNIHMRLLLLPYIPCGLIYTALSRTKSLECISSTRRIVRRDLQPPKEICDFMTKHDLL